MVSLKVSGIFMRDFSRVCLWRVYGDIEFNMVYDVIVFLGFFLVLGLGEWKLDSDCYV